MIENKKHELFIQEYMANGMNGTQAYLSVYPKASLRTAQENSFKLLNKTEIKTRIQELQAETIESIKITKESLINDLIEIKNLAKDNPKIMHNAIKSIEVINKMLGFETKKIDVTTNGESINQITWIEQKQYKDKEKDDTEL